MKNIIAPLQEYLATDAQVVQKLTVQRKLNKGKGYSLALCRKIPDGSRNNQEVLDLFIEVIESRKKLMQKQ